METPYVIAAVTLVIGITVWLIRITWQIAQISMKTDTMWDFQIRRAMGEAVHKGVANMNSPLTFNEEIKKHLDPLKLKLVEFWETTGRKLHPTDALLQIEKEFGDDLLRNVCIPSELSHGACLLLAYSVASQQQQISFEIGH